MKVLFLFSQYRSGSKLACSMLNSHPDIVCLHESLEARGRGTLGDGLYYQAAGDGWRERACAISEANPHAEYIILHGQADMLTEDMLTAPTEKMVLYRKNLILGAVKQTLMDNRRPHKLFHLNVEIASINADMRRERDALLFEHATMKFSYEQMTRGKGVAKMPFWLNRRLLKHIGADWSRLTTELVKAPPALPMNMKEIYDNA